VVGRHCPPAVARPLAVRRRGRPAGVRAPQLILGSTRVGRAQLKVGHVSLLVTS
jgi:hypothetical protein